MLRHPHYLEIPWDVHWQAEPRRHQILWWLIAAVTLLAAFLIGVGVTSGT